MTKIIGAPTLDDALAALGEQVALSEERGRKTLIFCEDRLTLLAERAVLKAVGGTFMTEVTTFARYLSGPRVLSKQGSVVELSALIEEYADRLVCFREGAAEAVYETIAQLAASKVTPDLLRRGAEESEGALKGKLSDLALLFEAYSERLEKRGLIDESGYLALLPGKIESEDLSNTAIIFFGFRSFTKQALEGVRAAIVRARETVGIFLAGRREFYSNEGARRFREVAEEMGGAERHMMRVSLAGDALRLSEGLFCPEKFSLPRTRAEQIRRFTARDEAEEAFVVAALVKKYVAEGKRFREIAVLVPDEAGFAPIAKAFSAFGIPFYADVKRPLSRHPFCGFALDVLSAVSDGVLPDEADAVAANLYFGNGDNYRNYLLRYGGYRGGVRREIKDGDAVKGYDRSELVACRERMLGILALFPRKGTGSAFAEGVRKLYEISDAEKITSSLAEKFTGAEREFLDLKPLFSLLEELESLAGERKFTAREFFKILKNGLDAMKIALIPQSADAVFVGDATESSFERVPVLFATGLTDALPRASEDTAVISDGEIEALKELKVEIEPAIAVVNARARESLALNLCAFTEALYLSCPLQQRGAETARGEVLQYAERLFTMPPMPDLFPFDCCEEEPAALTLLALKDGFERGRTEDGKKYSALYSALERAIGGEATERLVLGGEKRPVPTEGAATPTLLEGYFECPYRGFVNRALKLREREERTVLDSDAGTFVHAVLETCAKRFNELGTEEDCRALARATASELIQSRFSALSDTRAGAYSSERLVSETEEVTAAAYRQLKESEFSVERTEAEIALPELDLKGKTDRVDRSGEYVRVVDYKTGNIDDSVSAYYTGRKLQLELYLRAAAEGSRPAGAFYFPASESFTREGEGKYRMSGFFSGEDEVLRRMERGLKEGEKSAFFEGKRDGKYTEKGMRQEDFEAFLDYGVLVSRRAEEEMRAGNITPSPYEKVCSYCKMRSMCGFVGTPRKEEGIKSGEIVSIVRRERGEDER